MSRDGDRRWWTHYGRGLGISTRNNTIAYGYSVGATAMFAVLDDLHPADIPRIFVFIVGASTPFALVNALVTRGFTRRFADEPGVVSISAAVGLATLVAWAAPSWVAWLVASFVFSTAYLLAVGAETAVAAARHDLGGSGEST